MTDSELLTGLRQGNDEALGMLYRANYKMIQRFIIANSGSEQEAKDVYQEAIIVMYEKLQAGFFELHCRISTYLYAVCRRLWLRQLAGKRHTSLPLHDFYEVILLPEEQESFTEEDFQNMSAAMARLGHPCKDIIEAYYLQQKSMQQICELFGYNNADTAKNQKYKCLVRLRKLFFGTN